MQKFSLIDYPGKTCAILFTTGCNFRCHYCHNPELVMPRKYAPVIPVEEVYAFLEQRKGKLDAVCISGGEPTFYKDLPCMIEKIKKMGFLVKLDTNGTDPVMLEALLKGQWIDYVAMDIKAPLEDYKKVIGWGVAPQTLKKSIDLIMRAGIGYEFRTTVVKSLTSRSDLCKIVRTIQGAERYYLQKFIPTKLNNPAFYKATTYSDAEFEQIAGALGRYVGICGVR